MTKAKKAALALLVTGLFTGGALGGFAAVNHDRDVVEALGAYGEALAAPAEPAGPVFVELEPVTTNLRRSANGRFVQLAVTLRTTPAGAGAARWLAPHFTESLHGYLRGLDERAVEGSAGMAKLKRDLTARLRVLDPDGAVEDVLIRGFALQ